MNSLPFYGGGSVKRPEGAAPLSQPSAASSPTRGEPYMEELL